MRRRPAAAFVLALAVLATTPAAAAPPIEIVEIPGPGSTISFDNATGAPPTCVIEPGPISNTSLGYIEPNAYTAIAMRVPQCGACPDPQTLDLKTISFRIRWFGACEAQAEVSVVGAVQGGGCLVPDPTQVLCGPTLHTLTSFGSVGIIHTLPIPTGCCVTGSAFVLVRFTGLNACVGGGSAFRRRSSP